MNRRWNRLAMLSVMIAAVLVLSGASFACPMCKDSIAHSDAQQAGSLPSGFNNSVYLMLMGFFTVVSSIIAMIIKTVRDSDRRKPGFQIIPRDPRIDPKN